MTPHLCRECFVDERLPNDHLCSYCRFAHDFNAAADAIGLEREERTKALLVAIAAGSET